MTQPFLPKLPYLVYLTPKGLLSYEQNIKKYDSLKEKAIDIWVVNSETQFQEISMCHRLFLKNNFLESIDFAKYSDLKPGKQIIYLPSHLRIEANLLDFGVQFGFVTSKKSEDFVFCRYFSNYSMFSLRTLSCSEATTYRNLYVLKTHDDKIVKWWMKRIKEEQESEQFKSMQEDVWARLGR